MSCLYLPLLPPACRWGLVSCWLSLPFPPIISSFLQNHCPVLTLWTWIIPAHVSCLAFFFFCFVFPSKSLLQFVELISILILLSGVFALAPSLVPLVNLISVLYSLIQAVVNENGEQNPVPPSSQASLLRVFWGCFSMESCSCTELWLLRMLPQLPVGPGGLMGAVLTLSMLLGALHTLLEVCFILFSL